MSHPLLYEINTRCWLNELTAQQGGPVTLATVPDSELVRWQQLGFTHIWLMGVWTTGPRTRAQALASEELLRLSRDRLPEGGKIHIGASPYAIAEYEVAPALGGEKGLQSFRRRLHQRGMKLVLDFVPNHVGMDHPWLSERPELFVQDSGEAPGTFAQKTKKGVVWLAHGRDPHFPPWSDTVQLDYRRKATRTAMQETLLAVAGKCDGVRCDMAMLLLNEVFEKTWAQFPPGRPGKNVDLPASPERWQRVAKGLITSLRREGSVETGSVPGEASAGNVSSAEFWPEAIASVKGDYPDFLFLAEVYWGWEGRLQSLGFDYSYDKELYDELIGRNAAGVREHLLAAPPHSLDASAHFLENHDEPRIASILSPAEHRAAALLILSLPGMRFLHDGQLRGAQVRIPVQLLRYAVETPQPDIERMYEQMLTALRDTAVGRGDAVMLEPREAWPGNTTARNYVLLQWQAEPPDFDLAVVNLTPQRSQCYAPLRIGNLAAQDWLMKDRLGSEEYRRLGKDLESQGLYLDLPGNGAQLFHFQPIN